jgi:GntR family transcriptional regulator/MocR family aminotransferase
MAIPVESFYLEPGGEGTLQHRIQRLVAEGILSGRFRPGDRLPSSRKLAEHLSVSRITVTIAYTELVADDYLVSRGRSGYFVSPTAPRAPVFDAPRRSNSGEQIDWNRAIGQRYSAGFGPSRPRNWKDFPYPFIYGQTDARLFSHQTWRHCALEALGAKDFDALTQDYYDRDDPLLVENIRRSILPRRGIMAEPDEILITLGAQNALWIAAQLLLTQRRTAAMENPAYPGLREILSLTRCRTVAIDVDDGGLPPDALPEGTDAVFTTASHHCPTNVTMPLARRRRLLEMAAERGFVIVEDDYEFELTFGNTPSPALKSLDRAGSVVYIGSFSKSLFPGLRLGYLVASREFIDEARALRALVLRHAPGHIQRTAAYFLSRGHYDAQINRMRKAFHKRRDVMETAIRDAGLTVASPTRQGGSSFWMKAPDHVDTEDLAATLRDRGVVIEPGRIFFGPGAGPSPFYRIAYSSIAADRIPEGIARIATAIGESGPISAPDLALTGQRTQP